MPVKFAIAEGHHSIGPDRKNRAPHIKEEPDSQIVNEPNSDQLIKQARSGIKLLLFLTRLSSYFLRKADLFFFDPFPQDEAREPSNLNILT